MKEMGWKELFGLLLLILGCVVVQCQVCPNAADISPCQCKQYSKTSLTTCSSIIDMNTLYGIFGKSFDIPIIYFILKNCSVQYLPATSVSAKKFQTIQFEDSAMTAIFDRQPEPTNHLNKFRIYRTRVLRGIEWEFFSSFPKLTSIEMEDVKVRKLGKDFRENVGDKIESLKFSYTKTAHLEDGVFDRLINAKSIEVMNGKIKKVKRNMFPRKNKIWELGLSGNRIRSLPSDMFNNMPELRELYLMDNQITTLPEKVYGNWYRRNKINLNIINNPVVCDCRVRWITPRMRYSTIFGNCRDPPSMKGKYLSGLEPKDFNFCSSLEREYY